MTSSTTWERVALPVLRVVQRIEETGENRSRGLRFQEIARRVGEPLWDVRRQYDLLVADGYVTAILADGMDPDYDEVIDLRLTAKGARTMGEWPPDDAYDRLVELVERRARESSGDERTRWERLRQTIADVGKTSLGGLIVEAAKLGL